MGKFVASCVVLFVLAVGFVALNQAPETGSLIAAFRAARLSYRIAWAVIVLVPLLMLPVAAWLWDALTRQRKAAQALELRLGGVRARVKELGKTQGDVETIVQQLTRSDPEDALAALQRRVTEAERFSEVQNSRNEAVDLESRIGAIRSSQQVLQERLVPVLEARRRIETTFAELDGRQTDIDRSLAEVASGDDGVAIDVRLKNLTEFLAQGNARCDRIELASKTVATIKESCAELAARLAPFAAAQDGITARVRELNEIRDRLAAEIDLLERAPEGALADRVQKLVDDRKRLDDGISHLGAEFYKLAALRKDAAALAVGFDGALNLLSLPKSVEGSGDGADADRRLDGVSRFIEQTQSQFDDIERRVIVLGQLKTTLGDLHSRLVPLESNETGAVKLVGDLQDLRERLVAKFRQIEGGEEGNLAARVQLFTETKRELEDRVSDLSDQFAKLSTIRKDIAGLFDKLSSAVGTSSH
jgi:chromosome segregation ATPase